MTTYKVGKPLFFNGHKVFISAVNPDGTATIHFALGSGKKGFAGTLPSIDSGKFNRMEEVEGFLTLDSEELSNVSLDAYNNAAEEEDLYGQVLDEGYDLASLPENVVLDDEGVPVSSGNRIKWLQLRQTGITASEISKIVTSTGQPSGQVDRLLESKMVPREEDRMMGMYAHHGHEREPVIAAWVKENFGAKPNKFMFQSKEHPQFLATPDGLGDGFVVEIKTAKKSLEEMESTYMKQMQWQMYVMGYDKALFVVEQHKDLIPMAITHKWIQRDDEMINNIILPNAKSFIEKLNKLHEERKNAS
jgi:putative phage-type endonuclease